MNIKAFVERIKYTIREIHYNEYRIKKIPWGVILKKDFKNFKRGMVILLAVLMLITSIPLELMAANFRYDDLKSEKYII